MHPAQMTFPQHTWNTDCFVSIGSGNIHIGQSTRRDGGGSLNSISSCNSAARFLQSYLCWGRCAIWQSLLQYFTNLHAVHAFRSFFVASSSSFLPQLAQVDDISVVEHISLFVLQVLMLLGALGGLVRSLLYCMFVLFLFPPSLSSISCMCSFK